MALKTCLYYLSQQNYTQKSFLPAPGVIMEKTPKLSIPWLIHHSNE